MNVGNPNFGTEQHPGKATQFSSDNQPDTQGRPVGVKNRSTVARMILNMQAVLPDDAVAKIREQHPEITNKLSTEEVATIMIAGAAMGGDVNAYKALMDSAYGAPKQEIENYNTNVAILTNDPLSD